MTKSATNAPNALKILADAFDRAATTCHTKEAAAIFIARQLIFNNLVVVSIDSVHAVSDAARKLREEAGGPKT
jgi:hypothetical protein